MSLCILTGIRVNLCLGAYVWTAESIFLARTYKFLHQEDKRTGVQNNNRVDRGFSEGRSEARLPRKKFVLFNVPKQAHALTTFLRLSPVIYFKLTQSE